MPKPLTYKSSGVDIAKADEFVGNIQAMMKATQSNSVLRRTGAFGSLFQLPVGEYKEPILVSSTDGVGTKLLLAKQFNQHDTVGIDLVAMNVNDVLCVGAKPLFFLDYIACGQVKPKLLAKVVKGIARGCELAGCSLVGGETAEMPGLYKKEDYDLAGFTVGVVEKSKIIDGSQMQTGDRIIGLASSGVHSNGYSLVRKVFSATELKKMAAVLLEPTRIYVKPVLKVLEKFNVRGIAHNTGGAFYEKLTKIVPEGKCLAIKKGSWEIPEIFLKLQKKGRVPESEMYRTFNMGIGLILVVAPTNAQAVRSLVEEQGIRCWDIGEIILSQKQKLLFNS